MHTLEENIISKVQREAENVMTAVKSRSQDTVFTAIENLVIPRVELAKKCVFRTECWRQCIGTWSKGFSG